MKLIASYPIIPSVCTSYYGKPVVVMTHSGDTIAGVLDGVRDGMVYLKPLGGAPTSAVVQNLRGSLNKHPKSKHLKRRTHILTKNRQKANVNLFGPGFFGAGFGFGLGFALPLFLLAALFTFPFFW